MALTLGTPEQNEPENTLFRDLGEIYSPLDGLTGVSIYPDPTRLAIDLQDSLIESGINEEEAKLIAGNLIVCYDFDTFWDLVKAEDSNLFNKGPTPNFPLNLKPFVDHFIGGLEIYIPYSNSCIVFLNAARIINSAYNQGHRGEELESTIRTRMTKVWRHERQHICDNASPGNNVVEWKAAYNIRRVSIIGGAIGASAPILLSIIRDPRIALTPEIEYQTLIRIIAGGFLGGIIAGGFYRFYYTDKEIRTRKTERDGTNLEGLFKIEIS